MEHFKPYKGKVRIHKKITITNPNVLKIFPGTLGYYYLVDFVDHPDFKGRSGHVSMVVKEVDGGFETLNSRYEYA